MSLSMTEAGVQVDRPGMEALQREWAGQVVHADDAAPWTLQRIGGLDVHWIDDSRGGLP